MAPPRRKLLCAYTKTVNKTVPAVTTESTTTADTNADSANNDPSAITASTTAEPTIRQVQEKCKEPAQRIVGDCGFCHLSFCSKHRMLEAHDCAGIEECRQQERERNRSKLESERTVMLRGV